MENFKTGNLEPGTEPGNSGLKLLAPPRSYIGKLLFFYRKFLSGFCQEFTFDLLLVNINITKLIALGAKPINFYAVVVAVFYFRYLYLPKIDDECQRLFRTRYSKIVV